MRKNASFSALKTVKNFFEFNFSCLKGLLDKHWPKFHIERSQLFCTVIYCAFLCIEWPCAHDVEDFAAFERTLADGTSDVALFKIVYEQIGVGLDAKCTQL